MYICIKRYGNVFNSIVAHAIYGTYYPPPPLSVPNPFTYFGSHLLTIAT